MQLLTDRVREKPFFIAVALLQLMYRTVSRMVQLFCMCDIAWALFNHTYMHVCGLHVCVCVLLALLS